MSIDKKKVKVYFIKGILMSLITLFLWTGFFENSGSQMDVRYIMNIVIFVLAFSSADKLFYREDALKKNIVSYIYEVVIVGVVYFVLLIVSKAIIHVCNFRMQLPLIYIGVIYILYFVYYLQFQILKSLNRKRLFNIISITMMIIIIIMIYALHISTQYSILWCMLFICIVNGIIILASYYNIKSKV